HDTYWKLRDIHDLIDRLVLHHSPLPRAWERLVMTPRGEVRIDKRASPYVVRIVHAMSGKREEYIAALRSVPKEDPWHWLARAELAGLGGNIQTLIYALKSIEG